MIDEGMNAVYLMASVRAILYVGVTSNLFERIFEHKTDFKIGFTSRYQCYLLVYYEEFDDINEAIRREKQLKRYSRSKKFDLIRGMNPAWKDLAKSWYHETDVIEAREANRARHAVSGHNKAVLPPSSS